MTAMSEKQEALPGPHKSIDTLYGSRFVIFGCWSDVQADQIVVVGWRQCWKDGVVACAQDSMV